MPLGSVASVGLLLQWAQWWSTGGSVPSPVVDLVPASLRPVAVRLGTLGFFADDWATGFVRGVVAAAAAAAAARG